MLVPDLLALARVQYPRGDHTAAAGEPFEVCVEFVVLDGGAGGALRRRQAAVMRRVLQWIHEHPAEPPTDADEPGRG